MGLAPRDHYFVLNAKGERVPCPPPESLSAMSQIATVFVKLRRCKYRKNYDECKARKKALAEKHGDYGKGKKWPDIRLHRVGLREAGTAFLKDLKAAWTEHMGGGETTVEREYKEPAAQ